MVRINPFNSTGGIIDYFTSEYSREGYYTDGEEMTGVWGGVGAWKLGLKGEVGKEAFQAFCENMNPATMRQLTSRMKANRRIGYDINFHPPKSVTLLYELVKDKRMLPAVLESATETMREIEKGAATRVRKGGRDEDRPTGNLAWAAFTHFTTRPVGGIPDPHLHVHCFVFNATQDEVEREWKAAQFGQIVRDMPYYEAAFHARLAGKLRAMGYEVERVGNSFEVVGFSRELIEKFSLRNEEILKEAEKRGIKTAKGRDGLAALTREKKVKNVPRSQLDAAWQGRLTEEDKTLLRGAQRVPYPTLERGREAQAVEFAIQHVFSRKSVESEKRLLAEALRWGVGHVAVEKVWAGAEKREDLLRKEERGQTVLTTEKVMEEEDALTRWNKHGKGICHAINPQWKIEDERLNADQRKAVGHLLTSKDRLIGIQGKAGTGKTTLMVEAARAIEAGGKKLLVVAPSSKAAREVLRAEGFANADTVAKLLENPRLQEQARGGVLWIDEAGLLSTPQMARLAELADKLDARVILSGDIGQHHSVERGNAFEHLQKQGGLEVVRVEKVMRQTGAYREAVELIAAKKHPEALEVMERMGAFCEMPGSVEELHQTLAEDYLKAIASGKTALVVSPTHAEGREVSERIRGRLKERGTLGEGRVWNILRPMDFSDAQKADRSFYRAGQVVRLHYHAPGLAAGREYTIERVDKDALWVRDGGNLCHLPYSIADRWSVYEPDKIEVAKGDYVRITANVKTSDGRELTNGSIYEVSRFSREGEIILSNGARLGKDCGFLVHGYAITSHASQGQTVDCVFIAQSGKSLDAGDAEQFYVSVSRGKKLVRVYTDDLEALKEAASFERNRASATEVGFERKKTQASAEREEKQLPAMEAQKVPQQPAREVEERAAAERKRSLRLRVLLGEKEKPVETPPPAKEPERERSRGPELEM